MTKTTIEEKIVFAITETTLEGKVILLGVPNAAWEYMKDGKTHHLDLSAIIGVSCKLLLFGGESHDSIRKTLEQAAAAQGQPVLYERKDYGIKSMDPK